MTRVSNNRSLTPWTSLLPSEWQTCRIDAVADVFFSNVDKHSHDHEEDVRLCNYVDVYKNDVITNSLDFMRATAEPREIAKFQLRIGDVLATKDSEEPDDIAVPALVVEDLPGVICGYHLAMIRPRSHRIIGSYLAWLHRSKAFRAQYEAKAVGVTRFGLSQYAFRSAVIPLPSVAEQTLITQYLDATCAAVDAVVSLGKTKKALEGSKGIMNQQIRTLIAFRQSLIHECVTGQRRVTNADIRRAKSHA